MQKIILASTSPRRRRLLSQLFDEAIFEVRPSTYAEEAVNLPPEEAAKHHALGKAQSVAKDTQSGIIIGADTIGVLNGKMLGKPKDKAEAKSMLKRLSGKTVTVITGIAVVDCEGKKQFTDCETTTVKMKEMTQVEIDAYVKTGEPMDKAAAFAIQGKGSVLVERIEGCYSNVVGLPLFKLSILLDKVGISPLADLTE